LKAVIDSGLLPYFQEDYPITVFIPYDAAFKSVDYAAIAKDPNALKSKNILMKSQAASVIDLRLSLKY